MSKKINKKETKSLMFGDSFIKFFTLYKTKNIKIKSFSGKTMKGISDIESKETKEIKRIIKKYKQSQYIFFGFGQVDLHLSYFFKTYIKNEKMDFEDIIERYVKFIKGLKTRGQKIIIDVYPPTWDDKNVKDALIKYLGKEKVDKMSENKNFTKDIKFFRRRRRYNEFSKLLEKYCKKENIQFISFRDILLKKDGRIKIKILDIDPKNIHIRWEQFIKNVDKSGIMKPYGFKSEYLIGLDKEESEYLKRKKSLLRKE